MPLFAESLNFCLRLDSTKEPRKRVLFQDNLGITIWRWRESSTQHLNFLLGLIPSCPQGFEIDRGVKLKGERRAVQWCITGEVMVDNTLLKRSARRNLFDITVKDSNMLDDSMRVLLCKSLDILLGISLKGFNRDRRWSGGL